MIAQSRTSAVSAFAQISVPKLALELQVTTPLESQELSGKSQVIPNYWEGAIQLNGHRGTETMTGVGYLEMTGYDRAVKLGQH